MSFKSWVIPYLATAIGLAFVGINFVFGYDVNETHVELLEYLLVLTLGSGAIGAGNAGFKRYQAYKSGETSSVTTT